MDRPKSRLPKTLFYAFVALSCARAWFGPLPLEREAHAQLPNQGAQLRSIASETRQTNKLLQELIDHMKVGVLKVEVTNPMPEKR
ncbi:MAG: hypothetical protein ACF8XB_08720 [Planctomycetota bacterium JB042]